jgi:hypothetical protein
VEAAAHDEGKKGKRDMVVVAAIQKGGGSVQWRLRIRRGRASQI